MPPCGERFHKNHQHRCTHGTCDLPRGVRDRRSGRHLIRPVQAVQRPCGNRHKQESHADLTRELANRHPPNPCIHRHQRHAERTDGQHNRAAQRHGSCAETVHRPPAEELGNALAEGARQHNQAAHGGRIATVGLDIQRHDDQNRAERKERQRCRDGADGKGPILQHFKIQQRRLGECGRLRSRLRRLGFAIPPTVTQVAHHEPYDADQSHNHRPPRYRSGESIGLRIGEAEHQPAKTDYGQAYREEIRAGRRVMRAEIMQSEHGRHQRDHANHGHGQKDGTPAVRIGLPAAQRGADGRCHTHGHAHRAHRESAARQRINGKHGDLQHRPHHARARGLKHAPEQHPDEARPDPGHQRADREHRH